MAEEKIEIAGIPMTVMDRDVSSEDTAVCMRSADIGDENPFTDNQEESCFVCREMVSFRPYMAAARKICVQCAMEQMKAGGPH